MEAQLLHALGHLREEGRVQMADGVVVQVECVRPACRCLLQPQLHIGRGPLSAHPLANIASSVLIVLRTE